MRPNKLNVVSVFVLVTAGALVGMALGGVFGYAAGRIAPDLFTHMMLFEAIEPVGAAMVMGGTAGVLCGAALTAFGLVLQVITSWLASRPPR